ncbi:class II aldolase/adducin family protein [Microbacterium gilvum]|uniref:Class II aldolase/adducin family protein n=1 Tax=Microbacterium gilvum TaxID=1336204 RepID=A0ABP9ATP1_9MICO
MTWGSDRDELKADLAATLRHFGRNGYQYGLAGHATVRDAGEVERYWVNPAGIPFSEVEEDDLVLVAPDGSVVEGRHEAHGFQSQIEVHRARPELRAGFHVHATHIFAWSSAGGELAPLTTDSSWLQGIQAVRTSFDQPAAEALGADARILIQRAHGAVAFGATIAEAAFWFASVERAAYTQLLLEAAGRAQPVDAALSQAWRLPPEAADRQFRPLIEAERRRTALAIA